MSRNDVAPLPVELRIGSLTDQGGGKRRVRSRYFQTTPAKLTDRIGARLSFTLRIYGDIGRQAAELVADVPAAPVAI